ncbi:hypothetical protein HMPREF2692_02250 [Corynebacterium sp. HMSC036D03]|uniref:type II toxin-antitoxin system HipA family toxin n=1 Tax=Corynebacterium sp. HMSC036D03 TaxID=1715171 RepID=UPI0008AA1EB6|nr:HipA domain-containing protein [Corynebacterium sp. HMSC036D03]OHO70817.1 hypothetical protein HMPREF2692_02250 [Corynebacterium sp. HMSC036D03]
MTTNAEDFKNVVSADVYKSGVLVGQLSRTGGGVEFRYRDEYAGPSVSLGLPDRGEVRGEGSGALPPFFSGLLPEGHRLIVLQRAAKTSLDDELTLLLTVGIDTPGDVQIVAHGKKLEPSPKAEVRNFDEMDFDELIDRVDPHSLPGVQIKASDAMITNPLNSATGGGLLKLNPDAYPGLVKNEWVHLDAMRNLKIPVAQASIVYDCKGTQGLWVTRFDRYVDSAGEVRRLALEDAAQIVGIPPADKYRISAEEVAEALIEKASSPLAAARAIYIQFLYAWLTGNGDLHAKNISLLQRPSGQWVVAPAYDVPCTILYGDKTMALAVDGKSKGLKRTHWDNFAAFLGLNSVVIDRLNGKVLEAAQRVDLSALGVAGSPLYAAERELRFRRAALEL